MTKYTKRDKAKLRCINWPIYAHVAFQVESRFDYLKVDMKCFREKC